MPASSIVSELETLTPFELARILQTTPRILKGMIKRGEVPNPIQVGATDLRFSRAVIREWLARGGGKRVADEMNAAVAAPEVAGA